MILHKKTTRRNVLKAGLTSLAASTVKTKQVLALPKKAGEVRVLFLFGDYWHNSMTQEYHWMQILGPTGWELLFAQGSQFVTPELLEETDSFVFCRYQGNDTMGWSPDGIVKDRPTGAPWMTEEQEKAIVENVNRGMGLLPYHCSIWNDNRKKYLELLGVKKPIIHGDIRYMTSYYDMNKDHPITRGIEPFDELDEIFDAEMLDVEYEILFRARQVSPVGKRPTWSRLLNIEIAGPVLERSGGWTREVGDGRVVYLNLGSTPEIFWRKPVKDIIWRSAHWAMKKEIPSSDFLKEGMG